MRRVIKMAQVVLRVILVIPPLAPVRRQEPALLVTIQLTLPVPALLMAVSEIIIMIIQLTEGVLQVVPAILELVPVSPVSQQ